LLLLGHGAGGGVEAPDILAARDAALAAGAVVARITQPYRVAGKRAPVAAPRLDDAWVAAAAIVKGMRGLRALPLISAGRSSGARVACRTAEIVRASGVICLAFPLHAPGKPESSRLGELDEPTVPVLVVQGDRDAFGMPPAGANRRLVVIPGADHSLKSNVAAVGLAVSEYLDLNGFAR
jgi:predicted alpha/beta-hydrolase family hydrolase